MKLTDYIFGSRRGREANRLEREAMADPFLADAVEDTIRYTAGIPTSWPNWSRRWPAGPSGRAAGQVVGASYR